LTLAELLIATTIMVMIGGAMALLAATVHSTNDHCSQQLTSAQHARIVLDRVERAMEKAIGNEQFPACLVISEQIGEQEFPQTVAIWSPIGPAANPSGLPLVREIVLFTPRPTSPNVLLELRLPGDANSVPPPADIAGWRALADAIRTSQMAERIVLTDRLRTAPVSGDWNESLTAGQLRGVVRFRRVMSPTEEAWAEYRAATRPWSDLNWPLDSYRSTSGTRAVVCQTEVQMAVGNMTAASSTAVPFFGSTYFSYELPR
jgi:hypothetical protein